MSRARDMANLGSLTATVDELNKLDGFTGVVADLNYAKDLKATGVTATEFDYLDGVTSNIQTQFGITDISSDVTTTSIATSWLNHHFYKFGDFVFINFSIYGASATFSASDEQIGTIGTTANIPSYNAHFPTSSHQGDTALAVRIKGTNNTDGTAGQIRLLSMVELGVDTNIHVVINGFYKVS